jgi:hypothetical protein
MWKLGGHLGSAVSPLIDGQLDAEAEDRAWTHVLQCPPCRRLVEREGWVKRQLAQMNGNEPSARLLSSLFELAPTDERVHPQWEALEAWVAVDELEHKGRGRRRAGLALVGAGSVSVAVFGIATLGGASLGIGGGPAGAPASSLARATSSSTPTQAVVAPAASVRGRIKDWSVAQSDAGVRDIAILNHR